MQKITSFFAAVFALVLLNLNTAHAQNNVGINTTTPDASAALDVTATDKGMLVPRMTASQRGLISSPATGLLVYQTDGTAGFYFYNGTAWTTLSGGGASLPTQTGNAGKVLTTNGTTASWANMPGAKLELIAKKTAAQQTLSNASTTNTGDLLVFDNVTTSPSIGSYSTTTNAYTVGANGAGLYLIQVKLTTVLGSTANNTVGAYCYFSVNGSTSSAAINLYPPYYQNVSWGSQLPAGNRGSSCNMGMLYLNANDVVTINGFGSNLSIAQTLDNNGGCQLMIVKLL